MTAVVSVSDLVKTYHGVAAVDGISFTIEQGEVYGLLGANGAGKTTTVEILEGHRRRTSGSVSVLGVDPEAGDRDLRDRIGIVLQSSSIERVLTVREVLALYRSCYKRSRFVDECVELVGLADSIDKRVDRLSGGQKRRLDLALGIVGHPELLFLDEPTTGFDAAARRAAWSLIRDLSAGGTTVLLTSHYLDEVEHLADRVGVLVGGRLVSEGSPGELVATAGDTIVHFEAPVGIDSAELADVLGAPVVAGDSAVEVATSQPTALLHALTGWALERGVELGGLTVTRPSLEDLFLQLTADDREEGQ